MNLRRTAHRCLLIMLSLTPGLLVAPAVASAATAAPRLTAAPTLENASGGVRIVVVVTGSRNLTARQRPRTVRARVGRTSHALTRLARPTMIGRRAGTWRSAILRGSAATAARRVIGSAVTITIVDVAGTTITIRPVLRAPATTTSPNPTTPNPTTPDPTTPAPLFTPPATALEGTPAFEHLDQYFLNARFTNCAAGWPNCPTVPVVERYVHCPDGGWQYHRESSVQGADVHSYYTFAVTGANVGVDGAWAVSYTTSTGGNYVWQVSTTGVATGTYQYGSDPIQQLGPFQWVSSGC